jgi:prenyltransferase beta subunit
VAELQQTVQIQKTMIEEMQKTFVKKEQAFKDEMLILKQIMHQKELDNVEEISELKIKIRDLKEMVEVKETELQMKEQKWSELERIVVQYARSDPDLQDKLNQ